MKKLILSKKEKLVGSDQFVGLLKMIQKAADGNYFSVFSHQKYGSEKEDIAKRVVDSVIENVEKGLGAFVDRQALPKNNVSFLLENSKAYDELVEGMYLYEQNSKIYPSTKLVQHLLMHFLPKITGGVSAITEDGLLPINTDRKLLD